jgi:DNA (cytosine-5)-methyltransferase 1
MKTETKTQTESTENQSDNFYRFEPVVGLPTLTFKHLDLFSGIGGFALAAKSIWKERYENVGFCEIDKYCQKVLRKNFGNDIKVFEDIRNLRKEDVVETVDLLTGGDPCQPHSNAGKRNGTSDDRCLWDEMFAIIRWAKPRWIINENVVGSISNMVFDKKISNLENEGYTTAKFIIPACAVGADHKRERVWIVANTVRDGFQGRIEKQLLEETQKRQAEILFSGRNNGGDNIPTPRIFRRTDGISQGLDRVRVIGNAIVPQIAMVLLAAIKAIDDKLEPKR